MVIGHINKPWHSIPAIKYGGIEKYLLDLIYHQVGFYDHDIQLFSPGDSSKLKYSDKISLTGLVEKGLMNEGLDRRVELAHTSRVVADFLKGGIDVVHSHTVESFLPFAQYLKIPTVFTQYCVRSDEFDYVWRASYEIDPSIIKVIFVSESQKKIYGIPGEVIHMGVDIKDFPFFPQKQEYAVFVGAISPEKGVIEAIEVANNLNIDLKIAGKVKLGYEKFFEKVSALIKNNPKIEFIGEVDDDQRNELVGKAKVCLFPSMWQEPFGRVILESLAVGTPVVAFRKGSAPEILDACSGGFVVDSVSDMCKAVDYIYKNYPSPEHCREYVQKNFSVEKSAKSYNKLYNELLSKK